MNRNLVNKKRAIASGLLGMEGMAVEADTVVEYPCPVHPFGGMHIRAR